MLKGGINKPSEALNYFSPVAGFSIDIPINKTVKSLRYGFMIGDVGIIIDKALGSEIVEDISICAIPHTPLWFSGMVNIRGDLVPIFDLQAIFNDGGKSDLWAPLLVIGKGAEGAGILLETLPRALGSLEISELPDSIPPSLEGHIDTAYINDGQIWLSINFIGFFSSLGRQVTQSK